MGDGDSLFPFEFFVKGTPLSQQASAQSKGRWKETLKAVALERRLETYELGFIDNRAIAVTIFYFPSAPMDGDIDNIVKPILDALIEVAYPNDRFIDRVLVQKFEVDWEFESPSGVLAAALDETPPIVYIRIDDDLSWRIVA